MLSAPLKASSMVVQEAAPHWSIDTSLDASLALFRWNLSRPPVTWIV